MCWEKRRKWQVTKPSSVARSRGLQGPSQGDAETEAGRPSAAFLPGDGTWCLLLVCVLGWRIVTRSCQPRAEMVTMG